MFAVILILAGTFTGNSRDNTQAWNWGLRGLEHRLLVKTINTIKAKHFQKNLEFYCSYFSQYTIRTRIKPTSGLKARLNRNLSIQSEANPEHQFVVCSSFSRTLHNKTQISIVAMSKVYSKSKSLF